MRTMQDIIDDMKEASKQFEDGVADYEQTMPRVLKLKQELQDRLNLLSIARSPS